MNKLVSTTALLLALGSTAFSVSAAQPAITRASDFIGSQGVNLHVSQGTSNYKKTDMVVANMAYLGMVNVRDSYNPFWGSPPYSYYTALAKAGLKWNYIATVGGSRSPTTIATFLTNISAVEKAAPGSTLAVEGPNEINNFVLTWAPTGEKGLPAALKFQASLYSQTKATPLLAKTKVFYFTGYAAGGIPKGPDPATTPGLADYNNQHPYPYDGKPPQRWVNRKQALGNALEGKGPAVFTETGYQLPKTSAPQSAAWTLNLLANSWYNSIYRTYLYQLMDEGDGWGLFSRADNKPTPAAIAIHNLNTILKDTGATATTFTPANTVNYTVTGLPPTGNSFALQKSDKETDIIVWAEPDAFPGPATLVTVNLGAVQTTVNVYDPLLGTDPIQSLRNVSSVQVSVTDHPLVIQIPATTIAAKKAAK